MVSKRYELKDSDFILTTDGQVTVNEDTVNALIGEGLGNSQPMSARRAHIVQVSEVNTNDVKRLEGHEPNVKKS